MTTKERNLRKVCSRYASDNIVRLHNAFERGDVIRFKYVGEGNKGCLMYHLGGIVSRTHLQQEFVGDDYAMVHHVIRSWDDGTLSEALVRRVITEIMEQRQAIHAAEESTRRTVNRSLARIRRLRICF
jgi:hypothetical protein